MKRGDIVKYSTPVSEAEAQFRFVLLSGPEKGRVDIQLICDDRIKPIETVEVGEVEPAESTNGPALSFASGNKCKRGWIAKGDFGQFLSDET